MSQYSPQICTTVRPAAVDTSSCALPSWSPPQTSASRAQDTFFVKVAVIPGADSWRTLTPLLPGPTQFLRQFGASTFKRTRFPSNSIFASQYFNSRTTLVLALRARNRQNSAAFKSLSLNEPMFGPARACVATRLHAAKLGKRGFTERTPKTVPCAA